MKAKKLRRQHAVRFDENGLPRDANEWTEQDWRDLHEAMQRVIEKVGGRHGNMRLLRRVDRQGLLQS